jgi:hypothetical protein
MPARYVIHKDQRLVINYGWGRLTFADFRAQQEALLKDPDFDPSFNQLVDVTETTALDLTIEQAKTIARRPIYLSSSRRAVIAKSPDVFAMGRLMDVYHAMATSREHVAVFYDREAALQWLGLKSFPPDP